jgi:hypothetical protein
MRKLVIAALAIALLTAALSLPTPRPAHAETLCGTAFTDNYYKNSNDTDLVGQCTESCLGRLVCWGTKTSYVKVVEGMCYVC